MPMILTAAGVALFATLFMMYDESRSQELIEPKIKKKCPSWSRLSEDAYSRGVGGISRYMSKLARSNAKIRTGKPLHMEDVKNWTIDVLTDAFTRAKETAKHGSQ